MVKTFCISILSKCLMAKVHGDRERERDSRRETERKRAGREGERKGGALWESEVLSLSPSSFLHLMIA